MCTHVYTHKAELWQTDRHLQRGRGRVKETRGGEQEEKGRPRCGRIQNGRDIT